jgi:hypothetical protein
MERHSLRQAVDAGLRYLGSQQRAAGNIGDDLQVNAAIARHLAVLPDTQAQNICGSLCRWLLQHRRADGSFAIRIGNKTQAVGLHTTCQILQALQLFDPTLITSDILGSFARQLIAAEQQVGGPYYSRADEQEPDVGTNALIAAFIKREAAALPRVETYLAERFAGSIPDSRYYALPLALYALAGKHPSAPPGQAATTLQHALYTLASLDTDTAAIDAGLQAILAAQQPDGSWPGEAYIAKLNGTWDTSSPLTSVLCLAALHKYLHIPSSPAAVAQQHIDTNYRHVIRSIRREIQALRPPLRQTGLRLLDMILAADTKHEISLLPFAVARQLRSPIHRLSYHHLVHLSVGNLYNWMAYTMYDDFLDGSGQPAYLPMANVAMRAAIRHFNAGTMYAPAFGEYIQTIFTAIDSANSWEVTYCHVPHTSQTITLSTLPAYGNSSKLAERSYSHALPALGVLFNSGIPLESAAAKAFMAAFRHYLIARQLNDDLHDWEDDLRAGQVSPVVGSMLSDLHIPTGKHHLQTLLPPLREHFWRHTIAAQCQQIQRHTRLARTAIDESRLLAPDNIMVCLLDGLDGSVRHTLHEQTKVRSFLRGYTK